MTEKRTHCTVTMTEDLLRRVKQRCKQEDIPLSVWCRQVIKEALDKEEP